MHSYHAQRLVFSPTGTTRKIIESITMGLAPLSWSEQDLTYSTSAQEPASKQMDGTEVAIIGMPVHAGRIPALAAERLRSSGVGRGRGAVLVVVYGNRAYEDALLELLDIAVELGFVPVAAAAFVGEHSFSSSDLPIAVGRPDSLDLEKAQNFGKSVREKMLRIQNCADKAEQLAVPGNFPYRDGVQPSLISPETEADKCVLCGDCVRSCPSGAIKLVNDSVETDKKRCLRCCACIRVCQAGARVMAHPKILELGRTLHEKFAERREPELYL
jgi:ferredoxin